MPPVPPLKVPTEAEEWFVRQRQIRQTLAGLLGDFPPRPPIPRVTVRSREEYADFTLERFVLDDGEGGAVPGLLLLPRIRREKVPAILYHHWHGGEYDGGKRELLERIHTPVAPGPALVGLGFAVMAIDASGFGERQGEGPDGQRGGAGEMSAAKFELWAGRTLWGRMVRDDRLALDYLSARPEVDPDRIGAMGMSMGATRTWWLMALDDRVAAGVAVACLTRYQDLIVNGGLQHHGIYYFVPGLLRHFDVEAIVACVAPRALLCLNGDGDPGSPVSGIADIVRRAAPAWRVCGASAGFESEVFPGLGHEWTAGMWDRSIAWCKRWLGEKH